MIEAPARGRRRCPRPTAMPRDAGLGEAHPPAAEEEIRVRAVGHARAARRDAIPLGSARGGWRARAACAARAARPPRRCRGSRRVRVRGEHGLALGRVLGDVRLDQQAASVGEPGRALHQRARAAQREARRHREAEAARRRGRASASTSRSHAASASAARTRSSSGQRPVHQREARERAQPRASSASKSTWSRARSSSRRCALVVVPAASEARVNSARDRARVGLVAEARLLGEHRAARASRAAARRRCR